MELIGDRPGWDLYFLAIAKVVALRADCHRRQVGAVIVRDHRIVATGYNGAPSGKPGCLTANACPRAFSDAPHGSDYDNCTAVHAEANALIYAEYSRCVEATLYCTDEPCFGCLKLISGAGIAQVIVPDVQQHGPLDLTPRPHIISV